MAKRRTSGIQRRERASAEALNRRLDAPGGAGADGGGIALPDWRLLAIGGVLLVGAVLVILVIIFGSEPNPNAGIQHPDDGNSHVAVGTTCRSPEAPCGADPYSSTPATSGPHWDPSGLASWGVYDAPQNESQLIHNLEHGGIVIWYDPERVDQAGIEQLERYVTTQVSSGVSGRFKFILTPWGGVDELPSPIVVTAWRWSLGLDEVDTSAIDTFVSEHYGIAPEPNGGPAPPG